MYGLRGELRPVRPNGTRHALLEIHPRSNVHVLQTNDDFSNVGKRLSPQRAFAQDRVKIRLQRLAKWTSQAKNDSIPIVTDLAL